MSDFRSYRLERRTQRMKKVYQTSRVLNDVLNALTRDATPEEREKLIQKEVCSSC